MEKEEIPFGGIKVILCGDFMQNEAIGGDSLYVNSLLVSRYNRKLFVPMEKNRSNNAYTPEGIMQRTSEVFNQAKLYFLKEQFRCKKNDQKHMNLIRRMHNGEGLTANDINNFNFIDKKTLNNDPEWKFAPILVTSNFERIIVNEKKSILFAKEKGEIVFRWKIECKIVRGEGSIDDLDDVDDCPELFAYFVKGAPLIITKNINPNKNIANGTSGFYHSMLFDDEEMNKKISELELCTNVGEIITLSQPPDYIIVKIDRTINSESNLSIDNNISLIPISRK